MALNFVAALVPSVMDKPKWAWGILTGGAWMLVNFFLLFHLLKLGMGYNSRIRKRILWLCVIKFPILYLIGFTILVSRFFPVWSLVAGLTVFFVAMISCWFWLILGKVKEPVVYQELK
ncbi:MAG: hypothetical protein WCG06_05520 [Candidatus Omnitrophota bacterium]